MVGAVIYVRVSTKEQTENLSLPTQLRACEEYCRRQGYEVLERFHEPGALRTGAGSRSRHKAIGMLTTGCTSESWRCPSMAFVANAVTSNR